MRIRKCLACCLVLVLLSATVLFAQSTIRTNAPHTISMRSIDAVILGLVEGFTEYLPVSSTGHLRLAQQALGIGKTEKSKDAAEAYAICIQLGAILAVLSLYFTRLRSMFLGLLGRDKTGRQLAINTLVAFLPAVVVGVLAEKIIKHYLFGIWPIIFAWLVGGVVILLIARRQQSAQQGNSLETLTTKQALVIGCVQCVAMWPGVSRSLTTIVAGAFLGLSVSAAVEFSFLLGLITLGAATLYEGVKDGSMIFATFGWVNPLIGLLVAWIAAIISVKWMVGYLNRHGLELFGYYRIALAGVVVLLLMWGFLR